MGETNLFAIKLLGALAGTVLSAFLLVVLLRKRARAAEDWLLTGVVGAAALWHATNAIEGLLDVAGKGWAESGFGPLQTALSFVAPALLLHLSLVWASARALRMGMAVYPLTLLAWSLLRGHPDWSRPAFGAALIASAAMLLAAARRSQSRRAFYSWTAYSLAAWAFAGIASLLPLVCLIVFIRRSNIFDLLITRRTLFVFTLSVVTGLYLVVVRFLATWLESEFGAFGQVVETALILGAAITWLPVYQVIARFFSRESRMHVDFSRGLIEDAAAILDLRERAQYLIEQVGRTFQFRRGALVLCADPPQFVPYGSETSTLPPESLRCLIGEVSSRGGAIIHARRLGKHDAIAKPLSDSGFNYLFPLHYQDRLTGMMLLDTSPRVFLDHTEPTLQSLASEISLSLESCRLSESKAALEKELIEQQHLATLGGFAATIAHEVKNPLSSIKALAQLLQEDPDVLANYGQELAFIVGETNRLNSCVQQLLTFARPLPEANEEVALSELLDNTAAFLTPEDARPGVVIERRIQPGLRLAASDRKSIEQVIVNLLLNAVQASPGCGRVELEARLEGNGAIRVAITDEGPGIPAGIRARVFEPFFTTKPQGTGLGLAIVRKHVQHLGAELELTSPAANGHGTRVCVLFPGER